MEKAGPRTLYMDTETKAVLGALERKTKLSRSAIVKHALLEYRSRLQTSEGLKGGERKSLKGGAA